MKLITPEFVSLFVDYPRYSQSEIKDPTVIAKIFNPCGPQNWYLLEYDHQRKEAFSFVTGMFSDELCKALHNVKDFIHNAVRQNTAD